MGALYRGNSLPITAHNGNSITSEKDVEYNKLVCFNNCGLILSLSWTL